MIFSDQHTMPLPVVSHASQTTRFLPATEPTNAGSQAGQDKALLRRITGVYVAVGCFLLLGVMGIGILEAIGVNAIYIPTRQSAATAYNTEAILPVQESRGSQSALITTDAPLTRAMPVSPTPIITPQAAIEPTADPLAPTAEPSAPTAPLTPILNPPPVAGIVLPSVGIDAPVVVRGLDANGVMQTSGEPWSVAWYDFTTHPLNGGNAVFSGHVDYIDVGPAVFWPLSDVQQGDQIEIMLDDGTVLHYAVTAMTTISEAIDQATLDQILGPTSTASITLITCAGTYDASSERYDQRLIVRAERVVSGG